MIRGKQGRVFNIHDEGYESNGVYSAVMRFQFQGSAGYIAIVAYLVDLLGFFFLVFFWFFFYNLCFLLFIGTVFSLLLLCLTIPEVMSAWDRNGRYPNVFLEFYFF